MLYVPFVILISVDEAQENSIMTPVANPEI
jgi:hypothetical protein